MIKLPGIALALACSATVSAHNGSAIPEPMALDPLLAKFGWDLASTEITTEKVTDDFYVLFGTGGNIGGSPRGRSGWG